MPEPVRVGAVIVVDEAAVRACGDGARWYREYVADRAAYRSTGERSGEIDCFDGAHAQEVVGLLVRCGAPRRAFQVRERATEVL